MDLPGVLLQAPIFSDLTRTDVEELLPHLVEKKTYDAGQVVWVEGDPAEALFILVEGVLKSHRLSRDGGDVIVDLDEAVDVCGEIGVFHPSGRRQVNVTAMVPSRCVLLPRRHLIAFLSRHPIAMERLFQDMAKRAVKVAHAYSGMAFDDIRARAARTLLSLADEFGEPVPDGTRIRLQLSQGTLAAVVAASRENVNRALSPLATGRVISQCDGHFVVHDRATLEAVARGTL